MVVGWIIVACMFANDTVLLAESERGTSETDV